MSPARAPRRVLIPLPSYGFDPTESAVPFRALAAAGHDVVFATPEGRPAEADRRMLTGDDLPWLFRRSLVAAPRAVALYREMAASRSFLAPIAYAAVEPDRFDAVLLPGGHDKGMRVYLESETLQRAVAWFFDHGRPAAAICHGALLAARSRSAREHRDLAGRSVLWGRRTTGLTRNQEMTAYLLTRWTLGDYYRTYPVPMADELTSHLRSADDYDPGPGFPIPLARDAEDDLGPGFTVRDGRYLSARWPGDAHRFARELVAMLDEPA
jgi:putative intracellular protease/amidase